MPGFLALDREHRTLAAFSKMVPLLENRQRCRSDRDLGQAAFRSHDFAPAIVSRDPIVKDESHAADQSEIDTIVACAADHFGTACSVRLFGSRTDTRRGGDIDLNIEAETETLATLGNELECRMALRDWFGDQRIDVIIRPPRYQKRAIDIVALETGVRLL